MAGVPVNGSGGLHQAGEDQVLFMKLGFWLLVQTGGPLPCPWG